MQGSTTMVRMYCGNVCIVNSYVELFPVALVPQIACN